MNSPRSVWIRLCKCRSMPPWPLATAKKGDITPHGWCSRCMSMPKAVKFVEAKP